MQPFLFVNLWVEKRIMDFQFFITTSTCHLPPVPYARLEPRAESQSRSGPVGGDAKKRAQKPILAVTWVEI